MKQENIYLVTVDIDDEEFVVLAKDYPDPAAMTFESLEEAKVMFKDAYREIPQLSYYVKGYPDSFKSLVLQSPVIVELPKVEAAAILKHWCMEQPICFPFCSFHFKFPVMLFKMRTGFVNTYLRLRIAGDQDREQTLRTQERYLPYLELFRDYMLANYPGPGPQPLTCDRIGRLLKKRDTLNGYGAKGDDLHKMQEDLMAVSTANNIVSLKKLLKTTENFYYIIVVTVMDKEYMIINDVFDSAEYVWRYSDLSDAKAFFHRALREVGQNPHPHTYNKHVVPLGEVDPLIICVPGNVDVINDWVIEDDCLQRPESSYFGQNVCFVSLKPGSTVEMDVVSILSELDKLVELHPEKYELDSKEVVDGLIVQKLEIPQKTNHATRFDAVSELLSQYKGREGLNA